MSTLQAINKSAQIEALTAILGGTTHNNKKTFSPFKLIALSEEGISRASVENLISYLGVNKKFFTEDILDISIKTLERKKGNDKLDRRTSSHIIEIAKVVQHANAVFEDEGKTVRWLQKENKALNGTKPISLFTTLTGLSFVNDILIRIEEGIYS